MLRNTSRYLSLTLLVVPPLFLALCFFAQFPSPPVAVPIHPSLASLPPDSRSWKIYPEDIYPGGAYVTFPFGRVRYWLLGPESGEKVVLIHGLSVPSIIWKEVAPGLAAKGFRVLLYDLYGRGYSDAPQCPHETSLYTTQLALLMQHVKWDQAHLAALSMGGGIAAAFAASFPSLCTGKLALIASSGIMESSDFSRTSKVMSSPLVQSIASSSVVRMYLQRLLLQQPSPNILHEIVQIQSSYLPGFNHAVASSLRDGPIRGLASSFAALSSAKHKVLLIWGTADRTVPYSYAARLQTLIPDSQLLTLDGAGSDITVSHADVVREALVNFFRGRDLDQKMIKL